MNGYSFYFCYGPNAGFRIENGFLIKRIVLWKVSLALCRFDIEMFMNNSFEIADKYKVLINEKR